jgi:diacylglycerol kinase (ATP)
MYAAAILGPGNFRNNVRKFQQLAGIEWVPSLEQADVAVLFGGDGTVHRHLSSLVNQSVPLLVVPCGSGNDFARALRLRTIQDSLEAWQNFVSGRKNVRAIDLGVIRGTGAAGTPTGEAPLPHNHQYFCCVAGVGIDSEIARRANRLPKWLRAHGGYALSTPAEFFRFTPFPLTISRDGVSRDRFDPAILVAVANARAFGGGMNIAPGAKLDDGKLDICVVHAMNAFKMFCLFPTIYFGRHLGFDEVEYMQAENVRIDTQRSLDVYADGEYVCRTPVEFSVARNALRVIVPE